MGKEKRLHLTTQELKVVTGETPSPLSRSRRGTFNGQSQGYAIF